MLACTFENGNNASLRHAIVNLIALKDDRLLLAKRAGHLTNPGKWSLIGGFLDRDETLEQCVIRELHEETGYEGSVRELFCIIDNPNRAQEDRQNVGFIYIVNVGEKTGKEDDESTDITFVPFDQLPSKEEFAFDHYEIIEQYFHHLKTPHTLPFFIH